MKDTVKNTLPEGAIFKDVVIVGNGPSGIALSQLLAGSWPHLRSELHPDEMLSARLAGLSGTEGRSLLQLDLRALSQGLEGRTTHPLSLLLDALTHPGADLGLELPSMLQWRHCPATQLDHVVLGKGPPGGAWQAIDGNVLTISLASWMDLPGLDFRTWEKTIGRQTVVNNDNPVGDNNNNMGKEGRALAASVAQYYADYVRVRGLEKFFRSGTNVTNVEPLDNTCKCNGGTHDKRCSALWLVEGFDCSTGDRFQYVCRKVVLATGCTDRPNRLNVPGEMAKNNSLVLHDLRSLEKALVTLKKTQGSDVEPVLIVGAGLSAADAVLAARFHSLPVLHVFRNRNIPMERQLPEIMYPEYHKVHQMMGDGGKCYPLYQSFPEHRVVSLSGLSRPERKVVLEGADGALSVHKVSLAAVLIGARPDLSFLQSCNASGVGLGLDAHAPLDCRSNPMLIDVWTHRVLRVEHPGLYALGPLTGDNFVRFILGGAVAIASDILSS